MKADRFSREVDRRLDEQKLFEEGPRAVIETANQVAREHKWWFFLFKLGHLFDKDIKGG